MTSPFPMAPVNNDVVSESIDLHKREIMPVFGFYPAAILDVTQLASEGWVERIGVNQEYQSVLALQRRIIH